MTKIKNQKSKLLFFRVEASKVNEFFKTFYTVGPIDLETFLGQQLCHIRFVINETR